MLSLLVDRDLRAIWASCSYTERLFVVFFFVVTIYTIRVSVSVFLRLRTLKREGISSAVVPSGSTLRHLQKRVSNLRQLHQFTFYVMWFCCVINLPKAFNILGTYKRIPWGLILDQLGDFFHFYPLVLLVFLILHSVQWFVSARLDSFESSEST